MIFLQARLGLVLDLDSTQAVFQAFVLAQLGGALVVASDSGTPVGLANVHLDADRCGGPQADAVAIVAGASILRNQTDF